MNRLIIERLLGRNRFWFFLVVVVLFMATFIFGYRALYQDYSEGSGSDRFEYKATMHGPIFGLSIGF